MNKLFFLKLKLCKIDMLEISSIHQIIKPKIDFILTLNLSIVSIIGNQT